MPISGVGAARLISSNKGQCEERHEVEQKDAYLIQDDSSIIDRVKLLSRDAKCRPRDDSAIREGGRTGRMDQVASNI
jgi:hypothetical protein